MHVCSRGVRYQNTGLVYLLTERLSMALSYAGCKQDEVNRSPAPSRPCVPFIRVNFSLVRTKHSKRLEPLFGARLRTGAWMLRVEKGR